MLIRKIQKNIKNSNLQKKERSWGTKFGDLATFLPINMSFHNTHKEGGNFERLKKYKKTLNLNLSLPTQTSRSSPSPQLFPDLLLLSTDLPHYPLLPSAVSNHPHPISTLISKNQQPCTHTSPSSSQSFCPAPQNHFPLGHFNI